MAFATDFIDEGLGRVVERMASTPGITGATLAVAYHHGRDIFPHNPRRKVVFLEGGSVFFRPDLSNYLNTPIKPHPSDLVASEDVFARLIQATEARSLSTQAWIVYLHNTRLGSEHPDQTPRNAYGDPYLTNLCPANPQVVEFAAALTRDVARYQPSRILAESLHHHPLEHGYHHERYLLELDVKARFLLGLCFCQWCLRAADHHGVDGGGVHRFVRGYLDRVFAGEEGPSQQSELEISDLAEMAGGEMAGFLTARASSVTDLVQVVANAADNVPVSFVDPSGAAKGYADGQPVGGPAAGIAWLQGIDLVEISRLIELQAIGYAADPMRLDSDLAAYAEMVDGRGMSVVLRPMAPDCDSVVNLTTKIDLARARDIRRIDFYHYGLMQLRALDRLGRAYVAAQAT
jgi:hypothetical protein